MISRRLDFDALSVVEPELLKYWDASARNFNFSDHHAMIALTRTLVKVDMGYSIQLSETQLCPNYFNRLDYVLFLQRLIDLTPDSADLPVFGLDVGTSQSCIYPLLCTKYICNISKMIGTDIVPEFIDAAEMNIQRNNLSSLIKLAVVDQKENCFFPLFKQKFHSEEDAIVFTMCNPPFYTSAHQMTTSRERKNDFVKQQTIGHVSELITDGGDYSFIMKLLNDSESFSTRVTWFTSLIGNLSTLRRLVPYLKANQHRIIYGVHRFKSGAYTVRWILFWTYKMEYKPPPELFNFSSKFPNAKKFVQIMQDRKDDSYSLRSRILVKLFSLPYTSLHLRDVIVIRLPGNVFSRSYRRSGEFNFDGSEYIFELDVKRRKITWRNGLDHKVFESFCNVINSL